LDTTLGHDKLKPKQVLSEEDITTVAILAKQIWTQHYTPIIGIAQVDYMLAKFQNEAAISNQIEEGYDYTLWQAKEPIGYLSLLHQNDGLFISKIYLLLHERGKGYGKQMMDYAIAAAKAEKHKRIRLTVNKYNDKSIAAYEKLGFIKKNEVVFDIGKGYFMDDFEMELTI
tara:strand:+ start:2501 stop:3013 length:513 start_codon:yes stop_codon:yes gene_type:complete